MDEPDLLFAIWDIVISVQGFLFSVIRHDKFIPILQIVIPAVAIILLPFINNLLRRRQQLQNLQKIFWHYLFFMQDAIEAPFGRKLGWNLIYKDDTSSAEYKVEEEQGFILKACFNLICKDIDLFFSRQNADQISFAEEHTIKSVLSSIQRELNYPRAKEKGMEICTFDRFKRGLEQIKWLKTKEQFSRWEKTEEETWINSFG